MEPECCQVEAPQDSKPTSAPVSDSGGNSIVMLLVDEAATNHFKVEEDERNSYTAKKQGRGAAENHFHSAVYSTSCLTFVRARDTGARVR